MQRIFAIMAMGLVASSYAVHAQNLRPAPIVPRADVALGYNYIRSNAPPNEEPKFAANGAFASGTYHLWYWLGITGEAAGVRANNISDLGQNLTLITYQGGPRVMGHFGRLMLFGQGLIGDAYGSDSYFPTATGFTTTANSLAYSAGGGLDYQLTHHWGVRGQAEYLHTAFPNGVDNVQQHVSIGAGVVYRFGLHAGHPKGQTFKPVREALPVPVAAPPAPAPAPEPAPVAAPAPAPAPVPAEAAPMAPIVPAAPNYEPLVPQQPRQELSESGTDVDFHTNVKDVLFDYDSYGLNQDQLSTIVQAAVYLKMHPHINVLIGGFSDERGTVDYNLSLGEKRASAVKEALIAAGIDQSRVTIVSYGKGVQVCTQGDEACWKRNRRAAFMRQPEDLR